MSELIKTVVGQFYAEDTLALADALDKLDNHITITTKPGTWQVYCLSDENYIQELIIVHESIKNKKLEWILEPQDIVITSGFCGFYNLEDLNKPSTNLKKIIVEDTYCQTTSGEGAGSYNLMLAYNKKGETIAAKVIFIEDVLEDEEEYSNDFNEWYHPDDLLDEYDLGENNGYKEESYNYQEVYEKGFYEETFEDDFEKDYYEEDFSEDEDFEDDDY